MVLDHCIDCRVPCQHIWLNDWWHLLSAECAIHLHYFILALYGQLLDTFHSDWNLCIYQSRSVNKREQWLQHLVFEILDPAYKNRQLSLRLSISWLRAMQSFNAPAILWKPSLVPHANPQRTLNRRVTQPRKPCLPLHYLGHDNRDIDELNMEDIYAPLHM